MKNTLISYPVKDRFKLVRKRFAHFKNSIFDKSPKLLLLLYHRVLPEANFNPLNTIISIQTFQEQIKFLSESYPIISLTEGMRQGYKTKSEIRIILSFDDGYIDNYDIVFPILRKRGLPAAFFVATDYIGNGPFPDWKEICKRERPNYDFTKDRCVSWHELSEMAKNGMEIGSHGITHRSLASLSSEEAFYEIRKSKEILEAKLEKPCLHFAFPFGSRKDYNKKLVDSVKKAGYGSCLLNIHGYNRMEKNMFCFKRIIMHESADLNYLLG